MKDLTIYIPSRGRAQRLGLKTTTWSSLNDKLRRKTHWFVPKDELPVYRKALGPKTNIIGSSVLGIHAVRAKIINDCPTRYVLMLDDDLCFYRRPDLKSATLVPITPDEVEDMVAEMLKRAKEPRVAQVGLSARQGNNTKSVAWWADGRCMNVHLFDIKELRQAKVKLGRVPVMEDFDITLQLLRAGYHNQIAYEYCWNQRGSGEEGGCSTYRTAEVQAAAAHKLAELHPDFVKVVTKTSNSEGAWEGLKERTDVNVFWRKAAEEGAQ